MSLAGAGPVQNLVSAQQPSASNPSLPGKVVLKILYPKISKTEQYKYKEQFKLMFYQEYISLYSYIICLLILKIAIEFYIL